MSQFTKTTLYSAIVLALTFPVLGYAAENITSKQAYPGELNESNSLSMELAGIEIDPYTGNTIYEEC